MKFSKVTILVVVLAVLGGAFTADAKVKKRRSITKKEKTMPKKAAKVSKCALDMVEYQNQGMMMTPVAKVSLERKDNKVVLVVASTRGEESKFVLDDGEQLLKEALAIIEQEKMLDYSSSYELPPEMRPLDGYMWSFSARLADGRSVSSSGHNAGPGGEGLDKIHALLFDRAYKELKIDF